MEGLNDIVLTDYGSMDSIPLAPPIRTWIADISLEMFMFSLIFSTMFLEISPHPSVKHYPFLLMSGMVCTV